jgi:hypothetical protein
LYVVSVSHERPVAPPQSPRSKSAIHGPANGSAIRWSESRPLVAAAMTAALYVNPKVTKPLPSILRFGPPVTETVSVVVRTGQGAAVVSSAWAKSQPTATMAGGSKKDPHFTGFIFAIGRATHVPVQCTRARAAPSPDALRHDLQQSA